MIVVVVVYAKTQIKDGVLMFSLYRGSYDEAL
jgi:hypothetical protein